MSRSTRTFLFVSAFLSLYDGFVAQETLPVLTETTPNFKGSTIQPANLKPNLLSAAHRLFNGFKRPLNEITAPHLLAKPPVVPITPPYQQDSVNVNPAPNLPFTQRTFNTVNPVSYSPEILSVETVETAPLPIEYLKAVDQNYVVPFGATSFGQIPQAPPSPEALYAQNFVTHPRVSQFCQPPIAVQASPVITSTGFIQSVPSFFNQNNFAASYGELVPVVYQETANIPQITEIISPIETIPVDFGAGINYGEGYQMPQSLVNTPQIIGSLTPIETAPGGYGTAIDSRPGYQMPLSLQINMPSSVPDQPIIFLSPPTQSAPSIQDTSYVSPIPPMVPPHPLIVIEGSKSKWKSLLPILLLTLCDRGCQNAGNSGCCNNIPIPYPIPIPTNNPIILGGDRKQKKPVIEMNDDDNDDDDDDVVCCEVFIER